MNILRLSILALHAAPPGRIPVILGTRIVRRFMDKRRDRLIHRGPTTPLRGFTGLLPLGSSTPARLRKEFPASLSSLLSAAQKIRSHEFRFLGVSFKFGKKVQWHCDPVTGKEWTRCVYRETTLHDKGSSIDLKPLWELNRQQYFVTLAQAFYLSGDRVHLDELLEQWLDWIADNPYRFGINWASPLEIAVRLISWTIAYQFIEGHLSEQDRRAISSSVWQQASFLSSHLSTDKIIRTNHLIGEAAGLFLAASCFAFEESRRWVSRARRVLEEEIVSQFFGDGVAKEQSASYHLLDVDFFLLSYIKAIRSGSQFSARFEERLLTTLSALSLLQTSDDRLAPFGDSDDARGFIVTAGIASGDARGVIGIAAHLLRRGENSLPRSRHEESFWLLTEEEWNDRQETKKPIGSSQCTLLPEGGHVVLRNGLDYCFFRTGPFGMGGEGFSSHSHNDLFSPLVFIGGKKILTETGTSVYLGNDPERDYLRSAAAHNSTIPASWQLFEPSRWFGWKKSLDGHLRALTETDDEVRIECGYELSANIPYKRSFIYSPRERSLTIQDLFTESIQEIHTYFHLDAALRVRAGKNELRLLHNAQPIARLVFSAHLTPHVEDGWIAPSYGVKAPAKILHFTWNAKAGEPAVFAFFPDGAN